MRDGRSAAILVAGGQGSRLGFRHPKGMYPIGPISGHSLFQIFCEQLRARSIRAGVNIPYFVMTSAATHSETVNFFEDNQFFGLQSDDVYFFQQGNMPAVDATSLQILLSSEATIELSPDGHGGLLHALARADLFRIMRERGIETLYYHQVDNPTATVCDPVFLGLHDESQADISIKVVTKLAPSERMGAVVTVGGGTQIIEYSDLPSDIADATDTEGHPIFWAGSTAIHILDRDFLESLAGSESALPFHFARKHVPFLDREGMLQHPTKEAPPNAIKFERFIFDALESAREVLVVEANRADEFNPVKNSEGSDSPETSRAAILDLHRRWLESAGHSPHLSGQIEISPLVALEASDLEEIKLPQISADSRVYLSKNDLP